jgi:membrane-bound lytic murein transglycosylase MltF
MKKQKYIRALVTYSKTDFFLNNGRLDGLQVKLLNEYEKILNKGIKKSAEKIHIVYVPTTFDQLLTDLLKGRGDIAAALLTITAEREKKVSFASGRVAEIAEIIISGKGAEKLSSLDDLAGKTVYLLRGSSYVESIKRLNQTFAKKKLKPIIIKLADDHLLSEDILEMMNAGIVQYSVIDSYKAKLWKKVLPDITLYGDLAVSEKQSIGWAVRKNNPLLLKSLMGFVKKVKKGSYLGNMLFNRYYKSDKYIKNPTTDAELQRFYSLRALFEKYGAEYGFEALALAAQGFQESGLDQSRKSNRGAVGIMQLLPSTAADKNVGIIDIASAENNIHAGVKYLAFLRDRYFSDSDIGRINQMAFTWAAYNAGPAKVRKMRKLTKKLGLNPNVWFGNVEVAAGKIVGRETVHYVANIYKYYIAYTLLIDIQEKRSQLLKNQLKANK